MFPFFGRIGDYCRINIYLLYRGLPKKRFQKLFDTLAHNKTAITGGIAWVCLLFFIPHCKREVLIQSNS